jgi:outer membrane protein TolC
LMQLNSSCGINDTQTVFLDSADIKMCEPNSGFNFLEKFKLDSLAVVNTQDIFEAKYRPQVRLYFNTGLNAVEIGGIQRKIGMSGGIDFTLPIFDGGQKDITRQQNTIVLHSVRNYMEYSSVNIDNQKRRLASSIQIIQNTLKNLDIQLAEYETIIDLSNRQLQSGDVSILEYLTIMKSFIDLRKTKIEKEADLWLEINSFNYWNE